MRLSVVEESISCPFCGENISVLLDLSAGSQSYIEDCQVCCRPMQISFTESDQDTVTVEVDCAS
ncbi:MAG: CPXCG motif-containing cysteine-rich protein [Woeseiaceae bacterium]